MVSFNCCQTINCSLVKLSVQLVLVQFTSDEPAEEEHTDNAATGLVAIHRAFSRGHGVQSQQQEDESHE